MHSNSSVLTRRKGCGRFAANGLVGPRPVGPDAIAIATLNQTLIPSRAGPCRWPARRGWHWPPSRHERRRSHQRHLQFGLPEPGVPRRVRRKFIALFCATRSAQPRKFVPAETRPTSPREEGTFPEKRLPRRSNSAAARGDRRRFAPPTAGAGEQTRRNAGIDHRKLMRGNRRGGFAEKWRWAALAPAVICTPNAKSHLPADSGDWIAAQP